MSDGGCGKARIDLARVLRATLQHMGELLELDPWLPVPQSGCTFLFGGRKAPLPIGALHRILERVPHIEGECPGCHGFLMPFVFGGLKNAGGVKACCLECGRVFYLPLGNAEAVAEFVGPALAGTPFAISEVLDMEARFGPRRPLWRALSELGVNDLPDEAWADDADSLEEWPIPARPAEEPPAEAAPATEPTGDLDALWRTVRRRAPRTPPWLCRPTTCPVPLRAIGDFEPLLAWGIHDPVAPCLGLAALVPVPGGDSLALWVSLFTPFAQRDAIHAVMPPVAARDPHALQDVLAAAFARPLPAFETILHAIPTWIQSEAEGLVADSDWSRILRGSPALADGRALAEALADARAFEGCPSKRWAAAHARAEAHRHEPPVAPVPPDDDAFGRWWEAVADSNRIELILEIMATSWEQGSRYLSEAIPALIPSEEAGVFLGRVREASTRAARKTAGDCWHLHTFAADWYAAHGLEPRPLPVRGSRLADGSAPESLPMRVLHDDLVDWLNENRDKRRTWASVVARLDELAAEEGTFDGPAELGSLECPNCGYQRQVTPAFLESAAISVAELPRRAAAISCSRCNCKGARWTGPTN